MIQSHVKAVHQIEVTSRCNLRCKYCVHPKMLREKVDMDWETFEKAIAWAKICVHNGTQNELNLAGIGESTMHPDFCNHMRHARMELGLAPLIIIASNGVSLKEEHVKTAADFNIKIAVSLHRPEKAGPAVELCKRYGVLWGVSADPSTAAINWAGQLDWHVSAPTTECGWVAQGRIFVTSKGDIETCCLDGDGKSIIGNIHIDKMEDIVTKPYSLCDTCHLKHPVSNMEVVHG